MKWFEPFWSEYVESHIELTFEVRLHPTSIRSRRGDENDDVLMLKGAANHKDICRVHSLPISFCETDQYAPRHEISDPKLSDWKEIMKSPLSSLLSPYVSVDVAHSLFNSIQKPTSSLRSQLKTQPMFLQCMDLRLKSSPTPELGEVRL